MTKDQSSTPDEHKPEEIIDEYFPNPSDPTSRAEVVEIQSEAKKSGDSGEPPSFDNFEAEAAKSSPKPNLIVIGETGVGKSTLLNAIFRADVADVGVGKPVTDTIRLYESDESPVCIYDTPGLELHEDPKRVLEDIEEVIANGREKGAEHHLHLAWFCVVGAGGKSFQESARRLIGDISVQLPTFLVATQVTDPRDPELMSWLNDDVKVPVLGVVDHRAFCVLAKGLETAAGAVDPHGLGELISRSLENLPKAQQRAFAGALKASEQTLNLQAGEARKAVYIAAAAAAGIGATPVPGPQALLIVPVQGLMIARINIAFGVSRENAAIATLVSLVLEGGAITVLGKMAVAQLLKLIPFAGAAANAAIGGLLTLALGEAYIRALMAVRSRQLRGDEVAPGWIAEELNRQIKSIDLKELKKLLKGFRKES